MSRYQVRLIADQNCDSLRGEIEFATDDLAAAKKFAENVHATYGAGIEDTTTGQIDVGFGFGVPCPQVAD